MEPQQPKKREGTAYKDMTGAQKIKFVLKLVVCIFTFGMVFPNIMGE